MSFFNTRAAVTPVWLLVCAFGVIWSSPSETVATDLLIPAIGLAALAMLLCRRPVHAPAASGLGGR